MTATTRDNADNAHRADELMKHTKEAVATAGSVRRGEIQHFSDPGQEILRYAETLLDLSGRGQINYRRSFP